MGLETATYISDLNPSNPAAADEVSKADDHLRLIKAVLQATFPSITGALTGVTQTLLNYLGSSTALSVLGRSANSSGVVAPIAASAASGAVLRESGSTIGFGTIATAGVADNAITNAKLRDGAALTVVGRSANSSGDPGDIAAVAASDAVLRESGSTLGFGTIATAGIANDAVTYAKIQNVSATSRILGRKTAAAGDTEECTLSEILDFIGSAAQGDILYRGAATWARLAAGTSGQFLKTLGAGANPAWADVSVSSPAGLTLIETLSAGIGASVTSAALGATYKKLEIVYLGISHNSGSSQSFRVEISDDGTNWGTANTFEGATAGANLITGAFSIYNTGIAATTKIIVPAGSGGGGSSETVENGVTTKLRFSPSSGNFDAGTFYIYGIN